MNMVAAPPARSLNNQPGLVVGSAAIVLAIVTPTISMAVKKNRTAASLALRGILFQNNGDVRMVLSIKLMFSRLKRDVSALTWCRKMKILKHCNPISD